MEQKVVLTDIRKKDYFYEEAIKTYPPAVE